MLFNTLEINARYCLRGMFTLMLPAVAIAVSLNPCMKLDFQCSAHNAESEALLIRAEEYKDAKSFGLALPLLNDYLAIEPGSARALADKAYCLNGTQDYTGALDAADQCLRVKSDSVDALSNRAWALNHLERFSEALESSKAALNIDPADPESWCDQGEALMGLGDYKSALVAFTKHCAMHDDEWYAYDRRAACYDKLGMHDLAKQDRDKISSL